MASLCKGIPCAWLTAIHTPRIKEGSISENKGCTPKIGKHKSTNENAGTDKKRIRIEAKASIMAYSELVSDDDSGTPYRIIQNEPTPAPTKHTDQDNASSLTQITENLVALHIGHNPNHLRHYASGFWYFSHPCTTGAYTRAYGCCHVCTEQQVLCELKICQERF
jgi:hypothetical protein